MLHDLNVCLLFLHMYLSTINKPALPTFAAFFHVSFSDFRTWFWSRHKVMFTSGETLLSLFKWHILWFKWIARFHSSKAFVLVVYSLHIMPLLGHSLSSWPFHLVGGSHGIIAWDWIELHTLIYCMFCVTNVCDCPVTQCPRLVQRKRAGAA